MDTIERSEQIVITTTPHPMVMHWVLLALYHFSNVQETGAPHRPQLISLFLKMDGGTNEVDVYDYNPSAAKIYFLTPI